MKKLSLVIFIFSLALTTYSQTSREDRKEKKEQRRAKINELARQAEEGVLVYEKQTVFGIQLRTNGYGIFYEKGKMKTNRKTSFFRIDLTEIKEPKEEKRYGTNYIFGNSYIYGKRNYFYPLTVGYGQQYILGQKGNKNGVAVAATYSAGLSLGLMRPYYLKVDDRQQQGERFIKYSSADSALFLDESSILAGGGFGKGWGEIKVRPGAFVKGSFRFDFGRFNESVTALEIGASLDAYASTIPIMLMQKERRLFTQIHVAFLFGKRK